MNFKVGSFTVFALLLGTIQGCADSGSKSRPHLPSPGANDPSKTGGNGATGDGKISADEDEKTLAKSDCSKSPELYACGPFTAELRVLCDKAGGGNACLSDRWDKNLYDRCLAKIVSAPAKTAPDASQPTAALPTANAKLHAWYSVQANYDTVLPEVLTFYDGGRKNGCAAFMSSALRATGTSVPKSGQRGGYEISLVTLSLSLYLEKDLKWTRVTDHAELLPGDVIFSVDDAAYPGFPAHVYMFHKWTDKAGGIGEVIDNQDFIHKRNIFGYGTYNFSPFKYALRGPK